MRRSCRRDYQAFVQKRLTTTSGPHFGPTWSKELENEVSAECNNKYGKVVHIAVDANSEGEIFDEIKSHSFRCTCDGVCYKSPYLRPSGPRIGPGPMKLRSKSRLSAITSAERLSP